MTNPIMQSSLTAPRQRLLRLMQEINFGRIEGLLVQGGEPIFSPPPQVVREIKFGGTNGPCSEAADRDFALKASVREMFDQFCAIEDGRVRVLEIKHGLPFRMDVEAYATGGVA